MSSNYVNVKIEGLDLLNRRLRQLPLAIQQKAAQNMTSAGAQLIKREAKERCPVATGNLRDSIVSRKVSKGAQMPVRYWVTHSEGGRGKPNGWYAHIVEFGSFKKPGGWDMPTKKTGRKKVMARQGRSGFWRVFGTKAHHPFLPPQPYMRKAFDEKWEKAVKLMGKRLEKFITKQEFKLAA